MVRLDELQGRRAASTVLWGIAVYSVATRFPSFPAVKASRARQGKAKLRVARHGQKQYFLFGILLLCQAALI